MVGIVRSRSLLGPYVHGTLTIGVNSPTASSVRTESRFCDDISGNPMGQNPLTLNIYKVQPCILSGYNGLSGISSRVFENFPAAGTTSTPGHLSVSGPFKDPTQAIADHNPGQSRTSIPNFLYELKDLPAMLRHAGDRAHALHRWWHSRKKVVTHRRLRDYYSLHQVGEDFLNYQFGWLPFFSDIYDMVGIHDFLEQRKKKYSSIRNAELRSTGKLGLGTATSNVPWTLQSLGQFVNGVKNTTTTKSRWYSARYKVDAIRYGAALTGGNRQLLSDALGFDYQLPIQIWDAMPWTWAIDWCLNVRSIIDIMGNRQGCHFKDAVVMDHTLTEVDYSHTSAPTWLSVSKGYASRETKLRTLFSPSFVRSDLGFNILEPNHLAVIAALKVTRGKRSSSF